MWQPVTQLPCVTQVSAFHGTHDLLAADYVKAFLLHLQRRCVLLSYALSINIQQNAGGQVEYTVHTLMPADEVYALTVKPHYHPGDCTVNVRVVPPQALGTTNVVSQQLKTLRASNGN